MMLDLDKQQEPLEEQKTLNPFKTMWRQPRATIRNLLLTKGFWTIVLLGFLGSWASTLFDKTGAATETDYDSKLINPNFVKPNILLEIISTAALSILSILLGAAIIAFFYWLIGKLFKGTGTFNDLYKGSILTTMPYAIALPFLLVWLLIAPNSFYEIGDATSVIGSVFSIIVGVLMVIASIYAIVFTVVMISEVHQFSKWKAFGTLILPMIVFLGILILITLSLTALFI